MVKDISKKCYNELVRHNKNKLYPIILSELSKQPYTNRELSLKANIITSTLSPRIKELEEMDFVSRENKRKCSITKITAYEIKITKKGKKFIKKLDKIKNYDKLNI